MRTFCAAESRERGEAVFGTVARVRSWILIEYLGAWRRDALAGSRLIPEPVKQYIERSAERALLIRQEHGWDRPLSCFRIDSCGDTPSIQRAEIASYDDIPGAAMEACPAGALYAVCTHGRHDKCCSKFGFPVYCALRELVGRRAWQCSHVGGDRFAGNVVVFPFGIYYGRVTPDDLAEVVRCTEAGEVWMAGYRGRSCDPRPVQVAEYFARRESGLLRIDEFRPERVESIEPDVKRVWLRSRAGLHRVEFRTSRSDPARLTCHSEAPAGAPRYEPRAYEFVPLLGPAPQGG